MSYKIQTVKHNALVSNNIIIKPPKTNTKGLGATLIARYKHNNEETRFRTQTPRMIQAFDINADKRDDGSMAYSFNVSFRGDEENVKLENFRKMLEQMDEYNINYATENSASIFGKKKSREVIEENYTPMVKWSKKEGYRPTLKIKMPFYDEKPGFVVFDKNREPIEIEEDDEIDLSMFSAGCEAIHLLEFTGLWQTNNKFGGTWKLVQTKMCSEPNQLAGYMLDEDSDDEGVVVKDDKEEVIAKVDLIDDDDTSF